MEINTDKLYLVQNKEGGTALHMQHSETMQKYYRNWGVGPKKNIRIQTRFKELLLAKDKYGIIAWHWAAEIGSLKPLDILCSLAKEAELNLN